MRASALLAAAALASTAVLAVRPKYKTDYARTDDPSKINVHIIPHSHDDVGWLKTVDQYYYGANNTIQHANVRSILTAMVLSLLDNPDRKFSEVETAFWDRFWEEQTEERQAQIRGLVASGQLEFINGAWSMADEMCPSFVDLLDNAHLGSRLIYEQFGVSPRTTWQIDPFGHSAFHGSMLSSPLAGYNGVYVARMDYQDIEYRKTINATEMAWAPSPSNPSYTTVLGFLPDWYYAPSGFNFGGDDGVQPVMDDINLEDYNVPDVCARFEQTVAASANFTRGDVMLMMATDFSGENMPTWMINIDALIHHCNILLPSLNIFYSTPSIYTSAKIAQTSLPLRTEDVAPYADGPHDFWGYFSSRPALKGYIRDSSAIFQFAKQAQIFGSRGAGVADQGPTNPLYLLERAMGVTQHHDSVSGTAKQHVSNDYAKRLARGRLAADALLASALANLTGYAGAPFVSCDLANVTICPALESGKAAVVLLWNQLSYDMESHVRIPVGFPSGVASYSVMTVPAGSNSPAAAPAQILPLDAADSTLRTEYYAYAPSNGAPVQWLAFSSGAIPAMGYAVVFLQPAATEAEAPLTVVSSPRAMPVRTASSSSSSGGDGAYARLRDSTLTNGVVTLTFDAATGLLSGYANTNTGITVPLSQTLLWWNASVGSSVDDHTGDNGQASGAYIFRPQGTTPFPVAAGPVAVQLVSSGPVVWEARQVFAPWASQIVRLWANSSTVDIEYTIGPIPHADGWGKEVISRFTTGWDTAKTWISDSNGRDSITRVRDYRRSWNYTVVEPIAGNYVPVNLFTSTRDVATGTTLSVVTDRTQAGSSILDGSLELMLHRRLLHDDNRGVGEPLNETGLDGNGLVVRTAHRVMLDSAADAGASVRARAAHSLFRPVLMYAANTAASPAAWAAANVASFSALTASLPYNLHVVTATAQGPTTLLLRVAHMFAVGEDAALSLPATVSLATLFSRVRILSAEELILTGTIPLTSAPTTTYRIDGGGSVTLPEIYPAPAGPGLNITLSAMQIRTFRCQVAYAA